MARGKLFFAVVLFFPAIFSSVACDAQEPPQVTLTSAEVEEIFEQATQPIDWKTLPGLAKLLTGKKSELEKKLRIGREVLYARRTRYCAGRKKILAAGNSALPVLREKAQNSANWEARLVAEIWIELIEKKKEIKVLNERYIDVLNNTVKHSMSATGWAGIVGKKLAEIEMAKELPGYLIEMAWIGAIDEGLGEFRSNLGVSLAAGVALGELKEKRAARVLELGAMYYITGHQRDFFLLSLAEMGCPSSVPGLLECWELDIAYRRMKGRSIFPLIHDSGYYILTAIVACADASSVALIHDFAQRIPDEEQRKAFGYEHLSRAIQDKLHGRDWGWYKEWKWRTE